MKCIAKVANIANLSEKTKRQAISIMNEVRKKDEILLLSAGKSPMGLAATILYLSCLKTGEKNKTQNDIAQGSRSNRNDSQEQIQGFKKQARIIN